MDRTELIVTKDLHVNLNGHKVLEDINLKIYNGEFIGIIGPNGAGKTTLLRTFLGLLRPTSGEVKVFGMNPERLGKKRDEIGYIPQSTSFRRHLPLATLDIVLMGIVSPTNLGKPFSRVQQERARESLEKVSLLSLEDKPFQELSGGQQQRAFLARALCKGPTLLLLDEANTGLDLPTQIGFFSLIQELQLSEGLTVVMVSHDLPVVTRYADRLFCIDGTMHVHGAPAEVLKSPLLPETYRCGFEILYGKERD
jgi:zinc transport system ATP-binding protein